MSQTPTPEELETLHDALTGTRPAIVCYATCWFCKFGQCYEPSAPHPWWDSEDVEHAEAVGQPAPAGNCTCPCARPQDGAA
ncbi:hypothetical protein ACWELB_20890 [Streptomyces asiaticus]